jgi:large subunit ribosomal protein L11
MRNTKKVTKNIKVKIEAAKATPAPPLGPALGQAGINIAEFVKKFNDASAAFAGHKVSCYIKVYEDRSYDFRVTTPLTTNLIKKEIGIDKGSAKPRSSKAGKITQAQLRKIAEIKMPDLNATDIEQAMKVVAGTAKSMGVDVVA